MGGPDMLIPGNRALTKNTVSPPPKYSVPPFTSTSFLKRMALYYPRKDTRLIRVLGGKEVAPHPRDGQRKNQVQFKWKRREE
jgi:hypothetical protein